MADSPRFNKASFQEWKDHPRNKPFLQFLRDQVEALKDQWASGVEMDSRQQTKALLMGELSDLEWAEVAAFYEIEDTESGAQ
jgi:hypothetical protein